MEGRKIKDAAIYALYGFTVVLIVAMIYLMQTNSTKVFEEDKKLTYVSKTILENTISVAKEKVEEKMSFPFVSEDVNMTVSFYSKDADKEDQKEAIIYYQNTYMQSSGIYYTSPNEFDVISALSGKVTEIKEDDLLGNVVKITHENGLVTVYESLDNIKVKVNDEVKVGDMIATSGKSNLFKDSESGLYFEVISNGVNINPLLCYEKTISEIKG